MQSKATTVSQYLAELPADRRDAIEAVRKVILKNLDKGFEENMGYGMMGYAVPHSIFPDGYHCDPKQPLPFAGLSSQKQYMSLYIMGLYLSPGGKGEPALLTWFKEAWARSGKKKPDMGKCCIRFKSIDDLPLDVIGEAFRRQTLAKYVETYVALRDKGGSRSKKPPAKKAKAGAKPGAKKTAKKVSRKK